MEKIIKLAQKNYDFGLQEHLLNPYFEDLSSKPENVEEIGNYTIQELRAKKANKSLLFLLNAFVEKCPGSVFSQHGSNWVQLLIRNAADNQGNLSLILRILTNVIRNIVINNCKKELDSKAIEKIVEFCTQLSSRNSVLESLTCLELVLKTYPEHCSFVSKGVQKYLLQFVDNPSKEITTQVGVCFLYAYQVKGGLYKGTTLEQSWMQLQNSLMANMYETMNALLEEELFIDVKLLPGVMTLDTEKLSKPVLCQRLLNLTNYLDTALLMPLSVAKPIYAAKIVDLIYRVLEENSPFFANKNLQRDITIGPYLHHIHSSFLTLLRSTIVVLRSNALLFNKTICAVMKIVLKRSSRTGYHPYQSEYKTQKLFIFELIQEWIQVAKSGQDVESVMQLALDDVWTQLKAFETVVRANQDDKSQLLAKDKKSGSRKRKHTKSAEELTIEKASKNVSHIVEACLAATAALECLNRILAIFGHALNSNQHHAVLTNVHLFAKKLVEASMWESPLWCDDYNLMETVCKVLITFNSSSHHLHRSSINYTLSLLEMIRSCEPQNRQLCLAFQNNLETIFHYPRAPVVIINPSSALLQEPEMVQRDNSEMNEEDSSSADEEEEVEVEEAIECKEEEDKAKVNNSIVNGSAVETVSESIEIADDEGSNPALSISSGDEVEEPSNDQVMEVVELASGDEELKSPVVEIKTPKKAKVPRLAEDVDPKVNAENQASVDDIMSEFVDELM